VVLYLASDLLWATRIKSCAEDLSVAARPVRTLEMLEARLADSPVRGVLLDLAAGEEGKEGEIALSMLKRLKGEGASGTGGVRVVVFGPHVQAEQLAAARSAGADLVMTRGGLDANLSRVLVDLGGMDARVG